MTLNKEKLEVVIPAYNEAGRIEIVLKSLKKCPSVGKIYVVDDGSEDETHEIVKSINGINLLSHDKNIGKGAALITGIKKTQGDPFLIMDADLIGVSEKHISEMINIFKSEDNISLVNGLVDKGDFSPVIKDLQKLVTGIRLIKREVWENLQNEEVKKGYEVDYLIYKKAKKIGKIKTETLKGLKHFNKLDKNGPLKGVALQIKMIFGIIYKTIKRKILHLKK